MSRENHSPVVSARGWLADYGGELSRDITAIRRIDRKKLALDIAARKLDLKLAKKYARNRLRLR